MNIKLLIMALMLSLQSFAYNPKCSLEFSMIPLCYHARSEAKLNVSLIYYGRSMKIADLKRISKVLKERFFKATNKFLSLEIVDLKVMDFKHQYPAGYKYNNIKDPARLQRIWYYDNVGTGIMSEVYKEYLAATDKNVLKKLDALLAITGAQFDGLGFASGRVSVTEYPREIAWGLPDGGRVEYMDDYKLVDELIHELGHNMFLGHTSTHCQKTGLDLEQKKVCCNNSPSKNDVLSYCRSRNNVNETFMHGFEACNIQTISTKIVPAILQGSDWRVPNRPTCK